MTERQWMTFPGGYAGDFPDHVETTPQAQLNDAYIDLLEQQLRHTKALMLRAQVYLAIGETGKAHAALSQGVNS